MANTINSAIGVVESSIFATRQAVSNERDQASIAKKEEAKEPIFEGVGSGDPDRGNVIDIEA